MISARNAAVAVFAAAAFVALPSAAQTLYKYRGPDGEWIYTDRKPPDNVGAEVRQMRPGIAEPRFELRHRVNGRTVHFTAHNSFHAPIEMQLIFDSIIGMEYPHPDDDLRWVIPARGNVPLLRLALTEAVAAPKVEYRYQFLAGDPRARHDPRATYLPPFNAGRSYPITQAFPDSATHRTPDSRHAVDIAMPIGTDILAARGGIVFDVAAHNYKGGLDVERTGDEANVVRILHDDGTFSLYAHLNWNSIRVRPGDRVEAGQYIADSGNTGFSSGPHLHFAVQHNSGMALTTLPVTFSGRNEARVVPKSGDRLTADR